MYGGPIFQPHLTLAGSIERSQQQLFEAIDTIASDLDSLKLLLGEVSFSTTFFQSVFIRVVANAELMEQNLKVKKLLTLDNSVYVPHISLLYGLHDMKTREDAVNKVRLPNTNYNVEKFVVVPSTNHPEEWEILHQAQLNKLT